MFHSMSKNQVLSFLILTLKDYDVSVYWRIVCIKTNIEDPTEFGYPLLWPFLKESRVCLDILVNRSPTFGRWEEPSKREWSDYYYYSKEEKKPEMRILQAHK